MTEGTRVADARALEVPELSLVVLVGASGSGKSTFAKKHFLPTEILSSDFCRGLVADDENDQSATKDAFELLHFIAGKRMATGRLTVVDATSVKREDRAQLVRLARDHHFLPVAIVFDLPERLCQDRNRSRPDRDFGPHVIRNQTRDLRRGLRGMRKEGFRQMHVLSSPEEIEAATIDRTRLWNNRTDEHGPFDIIGDVHGCCDELERLLDELGYQVVEEREGEFPEGGSVYAHPEGRTAIFVGDLVDRGPRILDSVRLARNMVEVGLGALRSGQPRHETGTEASGPRRADHARPRPLARRARRAPRRAARSGCRRGAALPRLARQPLRVRRGQARRRSRRDEGGDAGTRLREGSRLRSLRRDDGRDGRVRPAGALELGRRVQRQGDGRLRAHARSGRRVAQPDDQHRHRLCLRRPLDGAPLPRAGAHQRLRGGDVLGAG